VLTAAFQNSPQFGLILSKGHVLYPGNCGFVHVVFTTWSPTRVTIWIPIQNGLQYQLVFRNVLVALFLSYWQEYASLGIFLFKPMTLSRGTYSIKGYSVTCQFLPWDDLTKNQSLLSLSTLQACAKSLRALSYLTLENPIKQTPLVTLLIDDRGKT
jgi:hypothetical protein